MPGSLCRNQIGKKLVQKRNKKQATLENPTKKAN